MKRGKLSMEVAVVSIIIIIALLGFLFVPGKIFPAVKEAVVGIVGEKGEVLDIAEETLSRGDAQKKEWREDAVVVSNFFLNNFNKIKGKNDCILPLDFTEISDKDVKVRFDEGRLTVIRGNELRLDRFVLIEKVYYLIGRVSVRESFSLVNGFSNINGDFELGKLLYTINNEIYFVDKTTEEIFMSKEHIAKKENC
jgi:hypothetical protein